MKKHLAIFAIMVLFPSFGTSAFAALDGDVYTCSNDVNAELQVFFDAHVTLQEAIDNIRETRGEDRAETYRDSLLVSDPWGKIWVESRNCLASLGYDVSALPYLEVPEFEEVAVMVLGGSIIFVILISKKIQAKVKNKID